MWLVQATPGSILLILIGQRIIFAIFFVLGKFWSFIKDKWSEDKYSNILIMCHSIIDLIWSATSLGIFWNQVMPENGDTSVIEKQWSDQASYISTTLIFYIISAATSIPLCCRCLNKPFFLGASAVRCYWYVFLLIWSFLKTDVMCDENWLKSDWESQAVVMKRMWLVQATPGSILLILIGLRILFVLFQIGLRILITL